MRPTQAFRVLDNLRSSFVVSLSRKGIELSPDDSRVVLDVYQQWLLLALDLGYLHPESLLRDAQRLWVDITRVDVFDLNSAFAELSHLVRCRDSRRFKGLCNVVSSHLYNIVKDDFNLLINVGDVLSAKRLLQLFSYTNRLSLNDIDLTQQLLEEYLENESGIPGTFPEPLVHRLNLIMKQWIGPFGPDEFFPHHSNGGVAGHGRCSLETKYKDLTSDELLNYAFGAPEWVMSPIRSNLDRISHTIFVPKSYKTFRTISMEPTTLQYFQQAVWGEIDSLVRRSAYLNERFSVSEVPITKKRTTKYMKDHIDFHVQERNRKLAQQGSVSRNFATLDLSAASDSVSYDLVKAVFKGTWLLKYLVATRSKKTLLPDGRIIPLRKFAPMGSSLCFPVETLLFASVCELVTRDYRVSGQYSVYGDDIIVPTQCVDRTVTVLTNLGFKVNLAKSFTDSACWFRESCGGEYCDGFDVTPMRVSRKYATRERDVRLAKLISLANTAHDYGFRFLRGFFIRKLQEDMTVPLFAPTSLLSDNYTNYHAKKRWNRDLQRIEVRVDRLVTRSPKKKVSRNLHETIRYRHWLESTSLRQSLGDGFQSDIDRSTVALKKVWAAKPYELSDQEFIDLNLGRASAQNGMV